MSDLALVLALRPATDGDDAFLRRLYASTRDEELQVTDWSNAQKEAFLNQQYSAQDLHYRTYPNTSFDVILAGSTPAGRLYVARWAREIRIVDIALTPEWRARGIATHYLRQLQAEAAAAALPLGIHVEANNRARQLYERLGFKATGDLGVYLYYVWFPPA